MYYRVSLKLKPGTQILRQFLRSHGFSTHRRDLMRLSQDNGVDDSNVPHYYECYYNDDKPLAQVAEDRIEEELKNGTIVECTTKTAQWFPNF